MGFDGDDAAGQAALAEQRELQCLSEKYEREGVDTRFIDEPFLEASELGDAESLRHTLSRLKPDERLQLIKKVDQQGCSGLLLAAKRGDTEVVRILIDAQANPHDTDMFGTSALHYAGGRGSARLLTELLSARAFVDQRDDMGETPLMWARGVAAVRALLEARADANLRHSGGRTALMFASSKGDTGAVAELAAVSGVDLNARDSGGLSAHVLAIAAGHAETGAALIRLGAESSQDGASSAFRFLLREEALHEAARRDDAEACTALCQEPNFSPDEPIVGETALMIACSSGSSRAAKALLEANADPTYRDPYLGECALLRAAASGASSILVPLLLEARADPSRKDLAGREPAKIAEAWGHSASAALLREAAVARVDKQCNECRSKLEFEGLD